jgi:hypothetical protein
MMSSCLLSPAYVLLATFTLVFSAQVNANQCLDLMPYDVKADGLPYICQSSFNGIPNNYSCQDYRSGKTRYRVLYRGGTKPKAVVRFNTDESVRLLSAPLFGDKRLDCPLTPPAGVPVHARHRGTGVCYDENDEMVACSVFEHATARQTEAHRFMTFYTEDPQQPVLTDAQVLRNDVDAMAAEIAYQIGMELWNSECCAEQAVEYLAQAYHLFPRTEAYKTAYRHSRATLAIQELNSKQQWD